MVTTKSMVNMFTTNGLEIQLNEMVGIMEKILLGFNLETNLILIGDLTSPRFISGRNVPYKYDILTHMWQRHLAIWDQKAILLVGKELLNDLLVKD